MEGKLRAFRIMFSMYTKMDLDITVTQLEELFVQKHPAAIKWLGEPTLFNIACAVKTAVRELKSA